MADGKNDDYYCFEGLFVLTLFGFGLLGAAAYLAVHFI